MIIVTPVQGWDEDTHHFHANLFTRTRVLRNTKERQKQMQVDLDLGHWESIDTGKPPPDGECMKTVRLTRNIDSSIWKQPAENNCLNQTHSSLSLHWKQYIFLLLWFSQYLRATVRTVEVVCLQSAGSLSWPSVVNKQTPANASLDTSKIVGF